jgi:hypothetical protein
MNRFRSGLVPLIALLAVVGCSSEPTDELRNGIDHLEASPTQLFLEVGQTKTVQVGAVDAQGNPLDFNYEVTATGPGITVRRDSSFLPIFVDDSTLRAPATGPRFRFIVEGTGYNASSFTVSAGGQDLVVPVQVIPQAGLAATFDDDTVDLGQVVALTAPAGITFTDTANLSIGGEALTILSQDASTINFIPPPSVSSPVTIHGVVSTSTPDIVYAPSTQATLVTPLIDTVDVTYTPNTAPALGQSMTMTSPNPLIQIVIPVATDTLADIVFPGQLPGREPGPTNIVVAPDSNSVTFNVPPNANGNATVVYFHFPGDYLRGLPTRPVVTDANNNIGLTLPAPISDTAPDVSDVVTLTAPAGFHFDPATAVLVGGNPVIITSIAGDGSSVSFVPLPGAAGIPQVDGVVPDAAPLNILTMSVESNVTVPSEVPTLAGSDDPSTAPPIATPAEGALSVLFDAANFDGPAAPACIFGTVCHFYELNVTEAGLYTITTDWNVGSDIDMYICPDPGAITGDCIFDGATGAHPEVVPASLTPGAWFIVTDDFAGDAQGTTLVLSVQHDPPAAGVALRRAPADPAKLQRLKLAK